MGLATLLAQPVSILRAKSIKKADKDYPQKLSRSCIFYLFAKYPDHNIDNEDKMQPFFHYFYDNLSYT